MTAADNTLRTVNAEKSIQRLKLSAELRKQGMIYFLQERKISFSLMSEFAGDC